MTRGESIKREIEERIATTRTTEILLQRERINKAIKLETERVYKLAENISTDEFPPMFKAQLEENKIFNEVRVEFENDGFEFQEEADIWYLYLAD